MVFNLDREYEENLVWFEYPESQLRELPHYYAPAPIETLSEYEEQFQDYENIANTSILDSYNR